MEKENIVSEKFFMLSTTASLYLRERGESSFLFPLFYKHVSDQLIGLGHSLRDSPDLNMIA